MRHQEKERVSRHRKACELRTRRQCIQLTERQFSLGRSFWPKKSRREKRVLMQSRVLFRRCSSRSFPGSTPYSIHNCNFAVDNSTHRSSRVYPSRSTTCSRLCSTWLSVVYRSHLSTNLAPGVVAKLRSGAALGRF